MRGAMLSRLPSERELARGAAAKACMPREVHMLSRRPCCRLGSERGRESMAPSVEVTQAKDAHRRDIARAFLAGYITIIFLVLIAASPMGRYSRPAMTHPRAFFLISALGLTAVLLTGCAPAAPPAPDGLTFTGPGWFADATTDA